MIWKTSLTKIGDNGEVVRGYQLKELIERGNFVDTIALLLKGSLPNDLERRMLNALFTACIDHGVGAPSTTVARTVASTGNSLHSALAAGILTTGEHHGGAIEAAARFYSEHVRVSDLDALMRECKNQKKRIPGYGHKVLTHDLRTETLFSIARETGFFKEYCAFSLKVESALNAIIPKKLPLNIDGSMAAIILDMGYDWHLAKGFFLIGRVPGLVAHIYEETMQAAGVRRIDESTIEYEGEQDRGL